MPNDEPKVRTRRRKRDKLHERVLRHLIEEITSGRLPLGSCLPSLDELAAKFDISPFPVRQALAQLEARGYVESRHGSGTYVTGNHPHLTVASAVLLCIEARADLFGDLTSILMGRLLGDGFLPGLVDTGALDAGTSLLQRALASDARFFVVHGHRYFKFDTLIRASLPERHTMAVLDWETDLPVPNLHAVLSDYVAGGRLVAEHLLAHGHRRVLMAGPGSVLRHDGGGNPLRRRHAEGFVDVWREAGGTYVQIDTFPLPEEGVMLNEDCLMALMSGPDAPTAVFGLRDVDAWCVQDVMLRRAPATAAAVAVCGFGDTPWSRAGHPPFTTVAHDLGALADGIMRILKVLRNDPESKPGAPVVIPPYLRIRPLGRG